MKIIKTKIIVKSKRTHTWGLTIGGLISIVAGIAMLCNPYERDLGGLPYWILGLLFFIFGLAALISLLDHYRFIIYHDRIEIKSFFRKRIIRKHDIIGYGVENYEGQYLSGERIRILSDKKSFKFHTSQYENLAEVKTFLKRKKIIKGAFKIERIQTAVAILFCILFALSPLVYDIYFPTTESKKEKNEEIDALGIPAKFNIDLSIIRENESQIEFKLEEYENYIFIVDKINTPVNMKSTAGDLVVFVNDKKYAQELSKKEFNASSLETPRIILVDEIIILE